MKEMTLQKMPVKKIYTGLKADLKLCIKFIEMNRPERVKLYFWTDKWSEIADKLEVICEPFSDYQKSEIEKVISELHKFFIIKPLEWLEKKSN